MIEHQVFLCVNKRNKLSENMRSCNTMNKGLNILLWIIETRAHSIAIDWNILESVVCIMCFPNADFSFPSKYVFQTLISAFPQSIHETYKQFRGLLRLGFISSGPKHLLYVHWQWDDVE